MEGQQGTGVDYKRKRNEIEHQIRRNKRRQIFTNRRLNHYVVSYGYPLGEEQCALNFQVKEEEATNSFCGNHMSMLTNQADTANIPNYCENSDGQFDQGIHTIVKYKPVPCNLNPRTWCEEKRNIQILDSSNRELIERLYLEKYDAANIPQAISEIQSEDALSNLIGIVILRKIVCNSYEDTITVIFELINHNLLQLLATLLKHQNNQVKLQSAWIICNIFAGDSDASEKLIEYGVLEMLEELLSSSESSLVKIAVWNIGNIMSSCQNLEILLYSQTLTCKIIKIAQDTLSKNLFSECVWAIKNICGSLLENKITGMRDRIIEGISFLSNAIIVGFVNEENFSQIIALFNNIHCEYGSAIVGPQLVEAVISKCLSNQESVYKGSIVFLSKIAEGNELYTQILLDHEILNLAHQFLLKKNLEKDITKQVLYMLSNIAAGCASQVQILINCQQLLEVCDWILKQSIDDQLRIQACYIFSQMSCLGNPAHVLKIYRKFQLFSCVFDILSENPQQEFIKALANLLFMILDTGSRCYKTTPEEFEQRRQLLEQGNRIRILLHIEQEFEASLGNLIHKIIENFVPEEIKYLMKYNLN